MPNAEELAAYVEADIAATRRVGLEQAPRRIRELLLEFEFPVNVALAWLIGQLHDRDHDVVESITSLTIMRAARAQIGEMASCVHRRLVWAGLTTEVVDGNPHQMFREERAAEAREQLDWVARRRLSGIDQPSHRYNVPPENPFQGVVTDAEREEYDEDGLPIDDSEISLVAPLAAGTLLTGSWVRWGDEKPPMRTLVLFQLNDGSICVGSRNDPGCMNGGVLGNYGKHHFNGVWYPSEIAAWARVDSVLPPPAQAQEPTVPEEPNRRVIDIRPLDTR